MKRKPIESIKLGIFVLTGLLILIFALYTLSKNRALFSNRLSLTTHFRNINGLLSGNNVRYNGIDIGSVKSVTMINDSTIEVRMSVKSTMKNFIRTSAIASVGTDGLIGNRIINITPGNADSPFIQGNETISSIEEVNTEAMLRTLDRSNQNIGEITDQIKTTIQMIRNSAELNKLLNDTTMASNLSESFRQLRETSEKANTMASNALETIRLLTEGKGTVATLLTDTVMAGQAREMVSNVLHLESRLKNTVVQLNESLERLESEMRNSKGPYHTVLRDTVTAGRIRKSVENIEKGTSDFAEDMKALQGNFLLRPYFKKKEKEMKKRQSRDSSSARH